MKKTTIILLVCVNVALLLTLMLGTGTDRARAQAGFFKTDYIMFTGRSSGGKDAVFVMDVGTQRIAAWEPRRIAGGGRQKRVLMRAYGRRDIRNDFPRGD